ncbi:MAG: hypothetical protein AAB308_03790, partial [Nitrospirota bacterium]
GHHERASEEWHAKNILPRAEAGMDEPCCDGNEHGHERRLKKEGHNGRLMTQQATLSPSEFSQKPNIHTGTRGMV